MLYILVAMGTIIHLATSSRFAHPNCLLSIFQPMPINGKKDIETPKTVIIDNSSHTSKSLINWLNNHKLNSCVCNEFSYVIAKCKKKTFSFWSLANREVDHKIAYSEMNCSDWLRNLIRVLWLARVNPALWVEDGVTMNTYGCVQAKSMNIPQLLFYPPCMWIFHEKIVTNGVSC